MSSAIDVPSVVQGRLQLVRTELAESYGRATGMSTKAMLSPSRFAGIPDVHYSEDMHFVTGDIGVSQWTLRGTTTSREKVEVRGCDFFTFANGKIVKKDSYWKIRDR
jgi:hypothetical protein